MLAKAVVNFFEIEPCTDGGAQNGQNYGEIVPPKMMNNVDPGENAQGKDEDDNA